MKKPHIKRYRLPLTDLFVWGAFQTRGSVRPFLLAPRQDIVFAGLADWTRRKERRSVKTTQPSRDCCSWRNPGIMSSTNPDARSLA